MSATPERLLIQIKKYPNRRYYDATRSRHVTLQDVHDLIVAGHDVSVSDSKSGDDITNLVLTQILLEKDQPKLDLFPSSILHMMIRTNRQALRTTFERFYGPFLNMMASSQKQMDEYVRQAMRGRMMTPLEWAQGMMRVFSAGNDTANNGSAASPADPPPPDEAELDELRAQISSLKKRLDGISPEQAPRSSNS